MRHQATSESIPEPDGSITTLIRDDQGNVVSRLHSRYLDNGALRTDYPDGKYTEQVLGQAEDGRYVIRSLTRDGMFEQTAISDGEQILVVRKRIDSDKPYASDLYTVGGDHIATAGTDGQWSLVGAPAPAPYDPYEVPHQYGPTPIEFDTSTWTGKFEAFGFGVLKGVYSLPITVLTLSGAGPVPASDAWKALGSNILHLVNPYDPAEFGKAWADMGKSFIGWNNDNAWVGAGEGTVNVLSLLAPGAVGKIAGEAARGATKGAVESAEEAAEQAAKLGGRGVAGTEHRPYITLPHDAPDPPPLPKDHPLFEGYHPTDPGPEYTNPDGNLRYPDDSDPVKPYAVPGTVVDHVQLPQGTVLGRFGYPGGEWMAPEGTPFAKLSLPPGSALKPYYEYILKDPAKLPPGWRIEQSQTAPWFHQPGMGTQYQIIAPPSEDPSVDALVDLGVLERIGRL